MTDYSELSQSLERLSRPSRAIFATCCALRYLPMLAAASRTHEHAARSYLELLTGGLGQVDGRRLEAAIERVDELLPDADDSYDLDYWVARPFGLVDYALRCARESQPEEQAANWSCGAALNLANDIDYGVSGAGLTPRMTRLEVEAQVSSIARLADGVQASDMARLTSDAAAVSTELERVLPAFFAFVRS